MVTNAHAVPPWMPDAAMQRNNPLPSWMAPRTAVANQNAPRPGVTPSQAPPSPTMVSVNPQPGSVALAMQQAIAAAAAFRESERPDEIGPDDPDDDAPASPIRAVTGILPDAHDGSDEPDLADDPFAGPPEPARPADGTALHALHAENASLRAQVAELTLALGRTRRDVLARSEGELVRLSLAVAERVLRREVQTDPAVVAQWAREAVEGMAAREPVVVAIAPDLARVLPEDTWTRAAASPFRLEVDATLSPGGCEVRAGASSVDASMDGRLAAVGTALTGSLE